MAPGYPAQLRAQQGAAPLAALGRRDGGGEIGAERGQRVGQFARVDPEQRPARVEHQLGLGGVTRRGEQQVTGADRLLPRERGPADPHRVVVELGLVEEVAAVVGPVAGVRVPGQRPAEHLPESLGQSGLPLRGATGRRRVVLKRHGGSTARPTDSTGNRVGSAAVVLELLGVQDRTETGQLDPLAVVVAPDLAVTTLDRLTVDGDGVAVPVDQ